MKSNRQGMNLGQTAGVFALGAAIGSGLSLLFAPAAGPVTRRKLGKEFQQARKVLTKKVDLLREAAVDKLGDTRQWLVKQISTGNGRRPARQRVAHHA